MPTYSVSVPVPSLTSPTNWNSRAGVVKMMNQIWSKYSDYIIKASKNSNIPASIITSIIAVESGGDANAGGTGHPTQGLMQWNRAYAKEQLEDELKKNRLTPSEKEGLSRYGINFDSNGKTRTITNSDQVKPELNIIIGSIVLGQLLDQSWGTDSQGIHLDRVIAVWNAGAYGDTGKKARQLTTPKYSTPDSLANAVNNVTSAYIKKMMGVNGALDVAHSDLKSIFG